MMIVDAHIHVSDNDKWFNTDIDASIERAVYEMELSQIRKALILPIPDVNNINILYKKIEKFNDKFMLCTFINILNNNEHLNLRKMIKEYGFKGVKIHPNLQGIDPMDSRLFKIYEEASDLEIPIIFDSWPQNDTILLESVQPYVFDKIAKQFKELKIIIAHLGGHRMWDTFFVARSNANVYTDISYILDFFQDTSLIKDILVFLKKLDEKIIYGSDFPEKSIISYYDTFNKLSSEVDCNKINNILCKNAEQLFKLNNM